MLEVSDLIIPIWISQEISKVFFQELRKSNLNNLGELECARKANNILYFDLNWAQTYIVLLI